jgi:lipopolysaccharide/colanic/teichoic acid biosynthesis glycosyltransferase
LVESAIAESDRHDTVQRLMQTGVHVQITGGVRGVDQRRVRSHPLADSSIMYLEPVVLHRWQLLFKRFLDVAVSGLTLALASPFILLGAIAVRAYDRGPSFLRQDRVDQAGRHYSVWTLRTVVTDDKLARLGEDGMNRPRSLWSDPYRTPVGRILEATCINELPQLFSVLRGTTSLVGHRPTWPGDPDAITNGNHLLRPGLTGLWRVETRYSNGHNEFLDEYYLENWSVTLDLVILLATVDKALLRLVHGESWRRSAENPVSVLPVRDLGQAADITSIAS